MVAELGTELRNASASYIVSVTLPDRRTLSVLEAVDHPFTFTDAALQPLDGTGD